MRTRIVIADRTEARFFEAGHADTQLVPMGTTRDPRGQMHDREINTDRPGRRFGGTGHHHDVNGENKPHKHEAEVFARHIADSLAKAHSETHFERLALIAPPEFLGQLRAALPKSLSSLVVYEVNKDLVHEDERTLASRIPREVYAPLR